MWVDARTPVRYKEINKLLLRVAEKPLDNIDSKRLAENPTLPANFAEAVYASMLSRQACASVVSNCVSMLWSVAVGHLHALEPDFPLYPASVEKFVAETRLPFLSYFSIYYSMCKKPFNGTKTQSNLSILIDLRHALQHDRPETRDEYRRDPVQAVRKWYDRLVSVVGKEGLLWQPTVRRGPGTGLTFGGEPPVMKMMKYPVAKWAIDVTDEIIHEIWDMLSEYGGRKKMTEGWGDVQNFHGEDEELYTILWQCGQ